MPPGAVVVLAIDISLATGLIVAIVVQALKFYKQKDQSECSRKRT